MGTNLKGQIVMKNLVLKGALAASAFVLLANAASAATLDDVKKKGFLQCGVNTGLPGFASPNDKGEWSGFDVDYCRAVAAAVFGDATKVKFTPLSAKDRLPALQSGEIDVLIRNTTWTLSRDTQGFDFTGVNYYDGQGFMINSKKLVRYQFRASALWRVCLCAGWHDDGTQPCRLFQGQQDGV